MGGGGGRKVTLVSALSLSLRDKERLREREIDREREIERELDNSKINDIYQKGEVGSEFF